MNRFDKLASQWDLNPNRVESAIKTTHKIKALLDIKDKDILDYGSGTGLISFNLFEDAHSILAMDNSKGMLDEMQRKIQEADITNIKTKLHDGNIDAFPKERFDLIITAMTLHHIKNPPLFIKNITKALKVSGYLAISDLELEDGSFHGGDDDGVEHFGFDKQVINRWFKEAGLEIVYLETNETIVKHKNFKVFLAIGKLL